MLSYTFKKSSKDAFREEIKDSDDTVILSCRTIRIGSHRYVPSEKVFMTPKGIRIVAPSLHESPKDVALQIQAREVVRMLVHFSKTMNVIFIYTMKACGEYIRKSLDMKDEASGPYYNPISKEDPYKRITLLVENFTEEMRLTLKHIFGNTNKVLDELCQKEANEILVRTCPKEIQNAAKMMTRSTANMQNIPGTSKNSNHSEIRKILQYPPGLGGIAINTEDYMCLAQDQFLNDVIIDFYLKYLMNEVLSPAQREKTYMFSTFFYKRLTTKPTKMSKALNPQEFDNSYTPAQKRHIRVKTWTKNVNIFDKDFIVVPINENCHWFLAIICFPNLDTCRSMIDNRIVTIQEIKKKEKKNQLQIGNTTITPLLKQEQLNLDADNCSERDEAEAEESDLDMMADSDEEEEKIPPTPVERKNDRHGGTEPIKQPCILIFDSLAGASRSRVVATLRDYLTYEYQTKMSCDKKFNKDNMKGSCPKIPQQNNFTDCGLYLLQYVEQFFKDPILDYSLPIKQLSNWFDEIIVTRKREEISQLLKALMGDNNPKVHNLPEINFPTLNGKLIENEEHQEDDMGDAGDATSGGGGGAGATQPDLTADASSHPPHSNITDTVPLRKSIKLTINSDGETRTLIEKKRNELLLETKRNELIRNAENNRSLLASSLHSDNMVKDIQNTLSEANKISKLMSDKRQVMNSVNQSATNDTNAIKSFDNVSDHTNVSTYTKTPKRLIKIGEDASSDSVKKLKRNEY